MPGDSLLVQGLGVGVSTFTALGPGLILGRGCEVLQAVWPKKKKKKDKCSIIHQLCTSEIRRAEEIPLNVSISN